MCIHVDISFILSEMKIAKSVCLEVIPLTGQYHPIGVTTRDGEPRLKDEDHLVDH